MLIATLIGVMIAIVVGVNLIPMLVETLEEATEDAEDLPAATSALIEVLPIVLVAVILMGAVAWIGGGGFSFGGKSESKDYEFGRRQMSGKDLLDSIKKEEEEAKGETEVLETPGTTEVPEVPKAPLSKGKSQGKPPWAK